MGLDDQILGELTKKLGIGGDQAKSALEKMLPFVKGKLPGGGGDVGLLSKIKAAQIEGTAPASAPADHLAHVEEHEKEAHVQEVAKHSGLSVDTVRKMLPEVASFLSR